MPASKDQKLRARGRPPKYRDAFCIQMLEYFRGQQQAMYAYQQEQGEAPQVTLKEDRTGKVNQFTRSVFLPTFERFCGIINVTMQSMTVWKTKHENFGATYQECLAIQKDIIIQLGAFNGANPKFMEFLLKNCHGMSDKQEIAVTAPVIVKFESDEDGLV